MSGKLDGRLEALADATEIADGRLDQDTVAQARRVTAKAGTRLGLGLESTVVALAGPTGAGKSQLFNALAGSELAAVGRRRPTTSAALAATWGDGADPLLDWLEIRRRHRLPGGDLEGLVLLDLPDFDSVEAGHRLEVDRIVALADLVVWVADPQKYADAALHEQYLRPLASHAAAMALVLNQADLLTPPAVATWRNDAERLLAEDDLRDVPVVVVSARTGDGLADLERLLVARVAARDAAVARLAADVDAAARALGVSCGDGRAAGVQRADRDRLVAALEEAAGVAAVVRAVDGAHRRRGALAAGWPFVRWTRRLRPDPLRRLRLPESPQPAVRTSLPPATHVQHAQVATATRQLAARASEGLPSPWPRLVREAATAGEGDVADQLDRAVAGADLHVSTPRWWKVAGALQRLLALAVAAGALWLLVLAVLAYLRVDDVIPVAELYDVPVPTWLLLAGAVAGIVLALLARLVNGWGGRRRARAAARSLRERVREVGDELVVVPVASELDAYERLCEAVRRAAVERPGRFSLRR
ncbi:MAG: 50S ribosome-binding GTPase [Thermoleophilia bacterium]|nr:50S ribosome-binding GTPase [Thermoleophilia bacterium]